MNKNEKRIFIIAGVTLAIIILLGFVLLMGRINTLQETVNMTSVQQGPEPLQPESPSILSDSSFDFAGDKTLSVNQGTVKLRISATPVEFKENTKAKVKVNGKTHQLKQADNTFKGTIVVSAFEPIKAEVIFQDHQSVRTEQMEDLDPFVNTQITWSSFGSQPDFGKNEVRIKEQVTCNMEDIFKWEKDFIPAQVIGIIDKKQAYAKNVKMYQQVQNEDELGFEWEDKIPLSKGKTMEIFVLAKNKYGFTYRYKLKELTEETTEENIFNQEDEYLEILNPEGKLLFHKRAYEEEPI